MPQQSQGTEGGVLAPQAQAAAKMGPSLPCRGCVPSMCICRPPIQHAVSLAFKQRKSGLGPARDARRRQPHLVSEHRPRTPDTGLRQPHPAPGAGEEEGCGLETRAPATVLVKTRQGKQGHTHETTIRSAVAGWNWLVLACRRVGTRHERWMK